MSEQKQEPQPSKSPILRISQKKLTEMFERGEAKIAVAPVEQMVKEFNISLHTPELYTRLMQSVWTERAEKLKEKNNTLDITIPKCPYTQAEITELEKEERRLGYLPKELSVPEDLRLLSILWPNMYKNFGKIKNKENRSGWFDYEKTIDSPNIMTTEKKLREKAEDQNRYEMNLNEYIISSQDTRLIEDEYFDDHLTYSRILGSSLDDSNFYCDFSRSGSLNIFFDHHKNIAKPAVGGRLVGKKG